MPLSRTLPFIRSSSSCVSSKCTQQLKTVRHENIRKTGATFPYNWNANLNCGYVGRITATFIFRSVGRPLNRGIAKRHYENFGQNGRCLPTTVVDSCELFSDPSSTTMVLNVALKGLIRTWGDARPDSFILPRYPSRLSFVYVQLRDRAHLFWEISPYPRWFAC